MQLAARNLVSQALKAHGHAVRMINRCVLIRGGRHTNLLVEAHVEEAVGLVQHQPAQLVGSEGGGLLKVVQQAARAGDQHRDTLTQTRLLLVALLTTKYAPSHLNHTPKLSALCAIQCIHVLLQRIVNGWQDQYKTGC